MAQTDTRKLRLYDLIGPEGRYSKIPYYPVFAGPMDPGAAPIVKSCGSNISANVWHSALSHKIDHLTYLTDPMWPGLFYKHLHHWLNNSVSHWSFSFKSSKYHKSQTVRARECSPPAPCHVSHVTIFFFRQSVEAYWLRVCYQCCLPPSSLCRFLMSKGIKLHYRFISYGNIAEFV